MPDPPKRAAPLPARVTFQLATRVSSVPDEGSWIHELKLDGYRIACMKDERSVRLVTRGGHDWTARFPGIVAKAQALPAKRAWLDGEVVVYDTEGIARFEDLQAALEQKEAEAVFVTFDLLHLDDQDLRARPLLERKKLLARLVGKKEGTLRYLPHSEGDGAELFRVACETGAEGVVSKRASGRHEARRSRSWLKIRCDQRQEFVVGGYTNPRGSRTALGALLVGVYDGEGQLHFAGKVGSGLDDRTLRRLRRRLDELRALLSPFVDTPSSEEAAHWARPVLVAEVRFSEWTKAHRLRHPVFVGLREDKRANDVIRERT